MIEEKVNYLKINILLLLWFIFTILWFIIMGITDIKEFIRFMLGLFILTIWIVNIILYWFLW